MPLYEYQCESCAHRFEVIQKYSDALIDVCPKCGSAVRKLFSSPAIQFKGSGWYITDYAKKSGAPGANTSGESGGKSGESSSDAKSDSSSKSESGSTSESAAKPESGSKSASGSKDATTSSSTTPTPKAS